MCWFKINRLWRTAVTIAFGIFVLSSSCGVTAGDMSEGRAPERIHAASSKFARIDVPIAGVAGGKDVVFVGEPLNQRVVALARSDGRVFGELPSPPQGFALPFIIHALGEGKIAVLDAGGLPQPSPFVPTTPRIYEYEYTLSHQAGFSATLVRTVSFDAAFIGFAEDFVRLDDGRYLLSDAVLGSVWIAEPNGAIVPGIVPKTFNAADLLPLLALCPTMPQITVNGYPFLFTGSTLPGISPLAVRGGTVYYYSPCARGIYAFPLSVLSDSRLPWERAADIRLVAATPADVAVEELLDFTFNPFDPTDKYLYAADPLALRVIRVDLDSGARQVVAGGARLFDFPSSLGFLPPREGETHRATLVVVSNQQERSPLTNDAVTTTTFHLPFVVARIRIKSEGE
jgi:hypothetical protein